VHARGQKRPFDLAQCPECGFVQRFPSASAGELARLYGDGYYVYAETDEARWARAVQQYAVHLLDFEGSGGRLLDVGCAMGHLAALARARGWRVTGIDLSAEAVSQAAARFGLDVRAGTLARHVGTLHRFDVVFMGDVIEHVTHPGQLLGEAKKVLVPGGCVCIDTPNWGGRWRRWGGPYWLGLNRFHVSLFQADTLARLLEGLKFADIWTGSYANHRYEAWASRPELDRFLRWLPKFISWRLRRMIARLPSRSAWADLIDPPPTGLEDARNRIEGLRSDQLAVSGDSGGDNLVALAVRP